MTHPNKHGIKLKLITVINFNYETSHRKFIRVPIKTGAQIHDSAGYHIQYIRRSPAAPECRRAVCPREKNKPRYGYATIYRTLRLLVKASLATECRFENGFTRFEYKNTNTRYDHLICTRCGVIVEFENERIEALQNGVARENRFRV